ncbi:SDR family oxidoreductase [Schaalia hyovaginalis]|uniref:SDR family NAD(P)-dependent oxidoreductase n=1 Tax=Schaalia hyovaginalis TaxID=29316 RepID=UPI0026EDE2C5|nr:SDR family oxidoreductase [Schaalia hyovaginalis]MDD7554096.1 SDR family oxidoreductase [Schaalia hyovaginalis]MDY3094020.1 SDR family oxidoreductase [Schaalia hyovaginalis]
MGTALITGATSGLGEEFAWQLAAAGHDLVLAARREDVLRALAERLQSVAGVRAEVIVADLSTPEGCAAVAHRIDAPSDAQTPPIGLLVNNAGFGLGKPFPDNDLEAELNGLDVMVRAVMVLSHHAVRAMRARGRGAILNVASVASRTGAGTYSAHKAWVVAFTEGLSEELRGTGVTATAVCPGHVRTAFFEKAGVDMTRTPGAFMAEPEEVVSEALDAVRVGRVLVTPTPVYKAAMAAMKLMPRSAVRAAMRGVPHM